jgi:hypothetical protein
LAVWANASLADADERARLAQWLPQLFRTKR